MRGQILAGLIWSDDQLEKLLELDKQGLSAGKISDYFCQSEQWTDRSRSAILGKLYRQRKKLGRPKTLARKGKIGAQKNAQFPQQQKEISQSAFLPEPQKNADLERSVYADDLADTSGVLARGQLVAFDSLQDSMCRWPMLGSGAAMLYCGKVAVKGEFYCICHGGKARRHTSVLNVNPLVRIAGRKGA